MQQGSPSTPTCLPNVAKLLYLAVESVSSEALHNLEENLLRLGLRLLQVHEEGQDSSDSDDDCKESAESTRSRAGSKP